MGKTTMAPFGKILIPLLLGIFLQIQFLWFSTSTAIIGLVLGCLLFKLCYLIGLKWVIHSLPLLRGIATWILLFWFGVFLVHHSWQEPKANALQSVGSDVFWVQIHSTPQEKEKVWKCIGKLIKSQKDGKWSSSEASILLYFKKDSTFRPTYGDQYLVSSNIDSLQEPKNPGEFPYKKYLSYNHIFISAYVAPERSYKIPSKNPWTWEGMIYKLRENAQHLLEQHIDLQREKAILSALVLGIRTDIDEEILNAYAHGGAMHILSVSGLHVALVFQLLAMGLAGLKHQRGTKLLYVTVCLGGMWGYALLTGMCPSVVRSVVMYSFLVGGEFFRRKTNTLNTVALTCCILLVYNPLWVMDIGFQLSFLAVAGIVYFQPKIYALWQPKAIWLDYIWQLTSVSIAAQGCTGFLGIFYFNQFPVYFLLTNLVVIPLSTIVLYGGLAMIFTSAIPWVGPMVAFGIQWLTFGMNQFLVYCQWLPGAVWDDLYISVPQLWATLAVLFLVVCFLEFKKLWHVVFIVLLIGCYQYENMATLWNRSKQNKIFVYHVPQHTLVARVTGRDMLLFTDMTSNELRQKTKMFLRKHALSLGIRTWDTLCWTNSHKEFPNVYRDEYAILVSLEQKGLVIPLNDRYLKSNQRIFNEQSVILLPKPIPINCIYNDFNGLLIADGRSSKHTISSFFNKKIWVTQEKGACIVE